MCVCVCVCVCVKKREREGDKRRWRGKRGVREKKEGERSQVVDYLPR